MTRNDETGSGPEEDAADAVTNAMREAAQRAADLARNPMARSLFAAGLVAAAAALTTNKKVRDSACKAGREAQDMAETAFDAATESATKIGAAMVSAATDAVRRVMNAAGVDASGFPGDETGEASASDQGTSAAKPKQAAKAGKSSAKAKAPSARGSKAKSGASSPDAGTGGTRRSGAGSRSAGTKPTGGAGA